MRLRSRKPRQLELGDAGRIDERLSGGGGQQGIGIADVAKLIIGSAQKLIAKAQVQGQAFGRAIIVLGKPGVGGDAVVVLSCPPSRLAKERGAGQKDRKSVG